MKIGKKPGAVGTDNYIGKAGDGGVRKSNAAKGAPAGDNVDISPRAREFGKVKSLLDSVPEVRGEMVVRLKTDIEAGDYQVDAGKVAEKMIERAIRDALYSKK